MSAKNDQTKEKPLVTIKKYTNRRLYNTQTSSYVTLEDLCLMVKQGDDFVVYDAKTGEDLTRAVLTQIIVEEENKGTNLLPISFLRQIISLYGDNLQNVVPRYLEHTMQVFHKNQENLRDYFQSSVHGVFPFNSIGEVSKQNLAIMERAFRMFTPFNPMDLKNKSDAAAREKHSHDKPNAGEQSLSALHNQLEELQKQLLDMANLNKGKGK